MDFQQRKLIKSEWESIEVPVSADELEVLNLIMNGYHNVNIKYNKANSLFTFLKIEYTESLENYLYSTYFSERVANFIAKYNLAFINISVNNSASIKKADIIRLQKNTVESLKDANIYEYLLLDLIEALLKCKKKKDAKWQIHYYTLYKLCRCSVAKINRHVSNIVHLILTNYEDDVNMESILKNAVECIEKNEYLLKYSDMVLYDHQKEMFSLCKQPENKLILYIAPTGTGKTLTPIGLSQQHRIIFVCAARHVGLALAKAAISVNKKLAFAFGCSSADDIRLHYFAAKEYTKNWKSGGIWKVDNSEGEKVEIMICDIKSYLPAMYYMLSFNSAEEIITYWDEPTITLDYSSHEFHEIIQKNWKENLIPNMVLSSATLPKLHELPDTIGDFQTKFPQSKIHNIVSHDCKKSIPILNKDGYVVLPHTISEDYEDVLKIASHCENYLTLLRYFDLEEVVNFISFVNENKFVPINCSIKRCFASLDDVNMTSIKLYYLRALKNILSGTWGSVYMTMNMRRKRKIEVNLSSDSGGSSLRKVSSVGPGINNMTSVVNEKPLVRTVSTQNVPSKTMAPTQSLSPVSSTSGTFGIYVTTKDAYSLTDGPTIFLANDVEKIAKFCIQQSSIPAKIMEDILGKITFNNKINEKISKLERDLDDLIQKQMGASGDDKGQTKTKKLDRVTENATGSISGISKIQKELDMLRDMVKVANLNETFIPNKQSHLKKWAEPMEVKNAFTSNIDDDIITKIMMLSDVDNSWKVLLLMGIGVFANHESVDYTEIMKELANQQRLYMIIASSDYIYGTNYQFCHGYLSKDMELTQEKIIQAMGRIGRNKIQQDYTVRFRDDEQISKLFTAEAEKPEVLNMNRLFNSNGHAS
jgi:hypothetical protein